MKSITRILLLLIILASFIEAKPLKSDGWNLMSVCVDINRSDIDMTGITQIQSQDGKFIFTGDYASWSDLDVLKAGYGYWVNGSKGVEFNEGKATGKLMVPLSSDGWNLMAMCEDRQASDLDMTGISQIQSQDGKFIFTGAYASWSDLDVFESGYGYWVNGSAGLLFSSKDGVSLPQGYDFQMINNQGVPQEITLDGYTIKLFANYDNPADQQQNHKGVKVQINGGELSELLTIQNNYIGENLVVGVYNNMDELVAVSELIEITTGTLPISVNISFDDSNGNIPTINTPPTLTPISDVTMVDGDITLEVNLNATDADGDTITFDANSSDTSSVTTSITGNILTLTRLTHNGGTYTITVSASDGNASDVKSFTLTVPNIVTDTESPVVTLNGSSSVNVTVGNSYTELGATVTDNVDTGLVATRTGNVDTNTVGSYTLTYTATDSAGNIGTATRIVNVVASDGNNNGQLPNGFTHEVINNLGESIVIDGDYGVVKLYANYAEVADDQQNHVGISVKLDGKSIPTAQIQNSYRGHEIVAVLYNTSGKLLAVSSPTVVDTSSPVTVIDLNSSGNGGDNNPISEEMMKTFAGKTFYTAYVNKNNVDIIVEIIADTKLSSLTWEQIRGASNSGKETIQVEGNRLYIGENKYGEYIKQVDNYLLMHDYKQDINGSWVQYATTRLYFNFNDAESYLSTLTGDTVNLPEGFTYRVINNLGVELESTITLDSQNFTVRLFSDENITANDQINHVGVFANVNGQNSTFQIQNSYANVVVAVYDETSKLVAVSDVTHIDGNTGISVNF